MTLGHTKDNNNTIDTFQEHVTEERIGEGGKDCEQRGREIKGMGNRRGECVEGKRSQNETG